MSDNDVASAPPSGDASGKDSFFAVRMAVFGLILLVGVGGLAYEYGIARPGFENAQTKLLALSDENIALTAKEAKTLVDVKAIVSKSPAETTVIEPPKKKGEDDKSVRARNYIRHDKYVWYHASPWNKPETIIVVYKRLMESEEDLDKDWKSFDDNQWKFSSVHVNQEVPAGFQRSVSKDATNPGDTPSGAGAGGGGGGGRQRPSGNSSKQGGDGKGKKAESKKAESKKEDSKTEESKDDSKTEESKDDSKKDDSKNDGDEKK